MEKIFLQIILKFTQSFVSFVLKDEELYVRECFVSLNIKFVYVRIVCLFFNYLKTIKITKISVGKIRVFFTIFFGWNIFLFSNISFMAYNFMIKDRIQTAI